MIPILDPTSEEPTTSNAAPLVTESVPPSTPWPPMRDYKPPFMCWFEADFWADRAVTSMTWLQRLFYRALLQAAFQCDTRPYLPDDDAQLWVLAGAPNLKTWQREKGSILAKFSPLEIDGERVLGNKRVLEEWYIATAKHETASQKGKIGRAKQLSASESRAVAGHSPGTAQAQPVTPAPTPTFTSTSKERKDPSSPDGNGLPVGFKGFWKAYPKKVAKGAAVKAWSKIKPDGELQQKILSAIETQKRTDQWQKDGGQYIPHPATWLNAAQWDDEIQIQGGKVNDGTGGIGIESGKYANRERVICET